MSSSSEVFSDISSYENRLGLQPPIKVNVRKKNMKQSLGLQNLRKESGIANDNVTKTFGLKLQSNTTSKISHALEVLKKFDNKYKIKTSGLSNITKVIDNSNSSTNVSVKSNLTNIQQLDPASQQPRPRSALVIEAVKPDLSYGSIPIGNRPRPLSQDKLSKNIREPRSVLPEVVNVHVSEDYESDFESSDSESLSVVSDDAKDDSVSESQPSARPRSALTKPNLHSSETESSIHTIADQESTSIENVGLFGNIRLFTFSDLGPEEVQKIDELILPVHFKDGSSRSRPKSGHMLIEKSIDESKNKVQRTLEVGLPIPSNVIGKGHTSLDKSSDCESIAESLSNSSGSGDSSVPVRLDIFTMDDLDSRPTDSYQQQETPLIVCQKESDANREDGAQTPKKHDVAIATGKLSNLLEDIEELIDEDSVEQGEEHVLSNDSSKSETSYESDNFSESEAKANKKSSEESLRLSRKTKSALVSGIQSNGRTRKHTQIGKWRENLPTQQNRKEMSPAKGKGTRVTEIKSEPMRLHLATRDVSVQTELLENVDNVFPEDEEIWRRKVRPQPVFEALNLSWDFDQEVNNGKSAFIFQHQTLTPEIIEALANQNPAEDALNQVLKQQISLTKHFMASQYKMYQTYCMSVKQLTSQYTPVTLEETKEFIRTHKKMRTHGDN